MPAITAKGTATGKSLAGSTLTVASVAIVTGASVLVSITYQNILGVVSGITWNGVALTLVVQRTATNETTEIWALHNATGATGDVVATFDTVGLTCAMAVEQVTGLMTTPGDKTASATGSSASPSSGNTATTTQAVEFLYGAIGTLGPSGDAAGTWSNSFTASQRDGTTGGVATTNITIATGSRNVSATGAYAAAKTGITSREWTAAIATFKANADGAVTLAVASSAGDAATPTVSAGGVSAGLALATAAGATPTPSEAAGPAAATLALATAVSAAPTAAVSGTGAVTLALVDAVGDAPDPLHGYAQTSFEGSVVEDPVPAEHPVVDPVTGYTPSVPEMAVRRSNVGVYSKGQAYFALTQDRDLPTMLTGGGGGFEMRLTFTLYALPEAFSSSDEIHELFSLHEVGTDPRDILAIGVTPTGHIGIITPGNDPVLSLPGRVAADGRAHEIYLQYSTLDALRLVYLDGVQVLRAEGPHVYDIATEVVYIRNGVQATYFTTGVWPREGYNSRFMLFNGRRGTTKCRCAIHRAYFAAESAELVWPMADCNTGELDGAVTPFGDMIVGDFTLVPSRYEPVVPTWPLETGNIRDAYRCLARPPYRPATVVAPNYRRVNAQPGVFDPVEDP